MLAQLCCDPVALNLEAAMPNYWRPTVDHQTHVAVAVNKLGLCCIDEASVEAVGINRFIS